MIKNNVIEEDTTVQVVSQESDFKFTVNKSKEIEFKISHKKLSHDLLQLGHDLLKYNDQKELKEKLFIQLVKNLFKKNRFLQLYLSYVQEDITEEEYLRELQINKKLYVIDIKYAEELKEVVTVMEILKSIEEEINVDEVADYFGLDIEIMANRLQLK